MEYGLIPFFFHFYLTGADDPGVPGGGPEPEAGASVGGVGDEASCGRDGAGGAGEAAPGGEGTRLTGYGSTVFFFPFFSEIIIGVTPETLYHRDGALLYIAYVMLTWAAPIPADRWHCSLWA